MKWLLTGLCIIAIATTPVPVSANVEGEVESAGRILIAYIPEHLQLRVPGQQHKHQSEGEAESAESVSVDYIQGHEFEWPEPTEVAPVVEALENARAGVIVSSFILGAGLGLIGGGLGAAGASEWSEIMPAAGLVLGGSILVIGGTIGVGISATNLVVAKEERRWFDTHP